MQIESRGFLLLQVVEEGLKIGEDGLEKRKKSSTRERQDIVGRNQSVDLMEDWKEEKVEKEE